MVGNSTGWELSSWKLWPWELSRGSCLIMIDMQVMLWVGLNPSWMVKPCILTRTKKATNLTLVRELCTACKSIVDNGKTYVLYILEIVISADHVLFHFLCC